MADFSTAAEITVTLDQSSLRRAKRELDDALGSVTVATDGSGVSGSARSGGRQSARQRRRDRRTFRLDRKRNEHLETIANVLVDAEQEGTLFGGGGDDDGGGPTIIPSPGKTPKPPIPLPGRELFNKVPKSARLGGGAVAGATLGQMIGEPLMGPARNLGQSMDFQLGDTASGSLALPFAAIADTGFAVSDVTKEIAAAPFELLSGGGVDFSPGEQFETTKEALDRVDRGLGPDQRDDGALGINEGVNAVTRGSFLTADDLADRPRVGTLDALRPDSDRPPNPRPFGSTAARGADNVFEAQQQFAEAREEITVEQQADATVSVDADVSGLADQAADAVADELSSVERQFERELDRLERDLRDDIRRRR